MRISEAIGDKKDLDVKFGTAVLHIQYTPTNYTIAEMEDAVAHREDPRRLIGLIQTLVKAWDLEDDDGVPIDLADGEAIRTKVGSIVLTGIVKAVKEDSVPSGEA